MSDSEIKNIVSFIRRWYDSDANIPLHAPLFAGNEKKYVIDTIDSTYVSSVGKYVDRFEEMVKEFTGASAAIATSNGTIALQVALHLCGVRSNDEVLTQALTFVATANAITHSGGIPVFIDSSRTTMGMSAEVLEKFLQEHTVQRGGFCFNKKTERRISACVPMHTFGHPVDILKIKSLCEEYNITLIEDAAESLGSKVGGIHTGLFGKLGTLSFNGNKTITTGGGGMIITNDMDLAKRAKHITTTAKVPHAWNFFHDEAGFNFRLPNLNAALGCAQMENLPKFLENKRSLAKAYQKYFDSLNIEFFKEPQGTTSNFWLNSIVLKNREERDQFLSITNSLGVMTRPIWTLMNKLPMYQHCESTSLDTAQWFEDRVVNIPSSPKL